MAVFADITNRLIRERGYDIEEIPPETAARNLLNILKDNQFVFFEYFMTDIYGHKRNMEGLGKSVDILNNFTETVWAGIEKETSILIISDHGNAEDLSTGDHTSNDVPAILFTKNKNEAKQFADSIHSLVDIYPWVLEYFSDK
jgi:2,3-bisphosphoglycerate-independent phosphoglycerate mutase